MIYSAIVSFILGIVFEQTFTLGWTAGVLVLIVSLALFLYFKNDNLALSKIILVIGITFCIGVLRMNFIDTSPDQNLYKLVSLPTQAGEKTSFEASIISEPDVRDTSARYTVKLASSTSLVLLIADRFPEFQYGDKIKVSGKLDLPKNFTGDNGLEFDYVSYLAKDKIHFVMYQPQIEKIENDGNKIISFLYSLKNIFIEKISNVVPEPNSSFLAGVIFGAKQTLGEGLLDDFKKVGLIHIVVLSGYNITIIAAGVFFLTSYFGKRNLGFLLSLISISLFAIMVGLTATVIRACIMAFIAILARFLGRPSDALRWLFIAGFLMLLWNPLLLFYDPSFQLSFAATLGLILFSQPIFSFISSASWRIKISKFIPIKFGIREIVASTLAVQLFVLPLLVKMSGFVSLISFVINPLVLPLIPLVMSLGALIGFLGIIPLIGGFISWPFGALSYLVTQIIISITEFSAAIPFATLQTGSISFFIIFLWYVFYGFVFYKIRSITITE
jgi:competence protein ComEC